MEPIGCTGRSIVSKRDIDNRCRCSSIRGTVNRAVINVYSPSCLHLVVIVERQRHTADGIVCQYSIRLWFGSHHRSSIKLQTVNHGTGVGVGLSSLQHCAIGDDDRLSLCGVESNKRCAGLHRALGGRCEFHSCCYHSTVDADLYIRLCLVGIRIVMIGFQCMLASRHALNGQDERRRGIGNLRQATILQIGSQHLVGNDTQSRDLHVCLVPGAAHSRSGTTCTDGHLHTVAECLRVTLYTGHGP